MNRTVRRCVGAVLMIAFTTAAPAVASTQPSVTAGGAVVLPAGFDEYAGDHVQLHVTARQQPDSSVQGRFSIVHHRPPGVWGRASGIITCLAINGNEAVASGMITHGALADGTDVDGKMATFTLVDNTTQDIAGFVFSFWTGVPTIKPCDPVFPYLDLEQGNITVHG